jgi:hypothetical protein
MVEPNRGVYGGVSADLRPELRSDYRQDRSIGELLGQVAEDISLLVKQEIQLAKTEMSTKVSRVGNDLVAVAGGGVVALVGGLTLVAALVLVLVELGVAPWLSALLVGGALAGVGYVMLNGGLKRMRSHDLTPERTMRTLKGDIQAVKEARP